MKNKTLFIAVLALSSSFFLSCGKNECDSNCDSIYPEIIFKIVNGSGQNLTCGPNKIYTSDKIAVKSYIQNVLTNAEKAFAGDSTVATTGLVFVPADLSSQYYLYINNIRTDSFQLGFQFQEGKTECCPSFYKNVSVKLNNTVVSVPFNVVK